MNSQSQTQIEPRKYAQLFSEMRDLLKGTTKPKSGEVSAKFHMVYLFIKGTDWKKAVDVTSSSKLDRLLQPFVYDYYHSSKSFFENRLSLTAKEEFNEVQKIIRKEMEDLRVTL